MPARITRLGVEQLRRPRGRTARRAARRERRAAVDPADAVGDLDVLRQLRDPRRQGIVASEFAGPAPAVPRSYDPPTPSSTSVGSPSCSPSCERSRRDGRSCRRPRGGPRSRTRGRAGTGAAGVPRAEQRTIPTASDAERLVVELGRLQRDVVAEPLRLLVGVGVAAHVHEQRGVVDGGALVLVETEPSPMRSAIRHWRSTCSIGWPKPRSMPNESAATSSASRT